MDAPEGSTPVNIPAPFLAEHGRICLENSELRRALADAQRHIEMLVEQIRGMTPTLVPEGATSDAS